MILCYPNKPTLLFLHGFTGSGKDWANIAEAFPDFDCFAPDLPHHGAHYSLDWVANFPNTAQWLLGEINREKITHCIPIGYSMGGRLALYFALTYPQKCRALILESSTAGIPNAADRIHRQKADAVQAQRLLKMGTVVWLQMWYQQPLFQTLSKAQKQHLIDVKKEHPPQAWAQSLLEFGTGQMPNLWERLSELSMPTLLISGTLDDKFSHIHQQLQKRLPNANAHQIHSGHNVHFEHPEAFSKVLRDFLAVNFP